MDGNLNRREAMQFLLALAGGFVLSGCGPKSSGGSGGSPNGGAGISVSPGTTIRSAASRSGISLDVNNNFVLRANGGGDDPSTGQGYIHIRVNGGTPQGGDPMPTGGTFSNVNTPLRDLNTSANINFADSRNNGNLGGYSASVA